MLNAILTNMPPAPDVPWTEANSIAFWIGSLPIKWYAIFILIGFIVAIFLACMKMWKRYHILTEPFYWYIIIGVPCAILGARIGSCAIGDANWADFFNFRTGGLAIEWGVVLDVIIAIIYFPLILKVNRYRVRDEFGPTPQVRKVSMWLYFDAILPTVLLAQFIGRWGNYFNQELYGTLVTDEGLAWFLHNCLPWMYLDASHAPGAVAGYYQPLFLWEGLINLGGFALLYIGLEFLKQRKAGDLAAGYLLWYGIVRLCLEPLRDDKFKFMLTFVMSGIFVAIGLIFIILNHCLYKKWRTYKIWGRISSSVRWFFFSIGRKIDISSAKRKIKSIQKHPDKYSEKQRLDANQNLNNCELAYSSKKEEYKNLSFKRLDSEVAYFCRW